MQRPDITHRGVYEDSHPSPTVKIGSAILLAADFLVPRNEHGRGCSGRDKTASPLDRTTGQQSRSHSRVLALKWRLTAWSRFPPTRLFPCWRAEPGLLLECKKLLVRTAYAQGRVIDPEDLTDEDVFRLVRQDENTRVLFTREIESRAYVRAKPTLEERAQNAAAPETPQAMLAGTAGTSAPNPKSQEDLYWSQPQGNVPGLGVSPGTNPIPAIAAAELRRQLYPPTILAVYCCWPRPNPLPAVAAVPTAMLGGMSPLGV